MEIKSAPRIYCIPASKAPVVAVFRRGPSAWSHVGRWDLARNCYESGAWLHGRIFPRRSDLSPDGRFLACFVHKTDSRWDHGEAYIAVSKLPWLTALHAFATCGTWTRGYYFTEGGSCLPDGLKSLPIPYGLCPIPVVQFANERRRGWEESPYSPPRSLGDAWDQYRNARMRKGQPGGRRVLHVESLGWAGGEFGKDHAVDGMRVLYSMESGGEVELLDDVQWADWDPKGRLLVATRSGKLQVRVLDGTRPKTVFDEDLSPLEPDPAPAPSWAQRW
ncbi:MAG: hypothetical protein ACLGPL_11195 [Acidobacteriota bacterium]